MTTAHQQTVYRGYRAKVVRRLRIFSLASLGVSISVAPLLLMSQSKPGGEKTLSLATASVVLMSTIVLVDVI